MKKETCMDCVFLEEGENGEWICNSRETLIDEVIKCPEGILDACRPDLSKGEAVAVFFNSKGLHEKVYIMLTENLNDEFLKEILKEGKSDTFYIAPNKSAFIRTVKDTDDLARIITGITSVSAHEEELFLNHDDERKNYASDEEFLRYYPDGWYAEGCFVYPVQDTYPDFLRIMPFRKLAKDENAADLYIEGLDDAVEKVKKDVPVSLNRWELTDQPGC